MKEKIIKGLYEIYHKYDAFLIDLWGVVHNGLELYSGAIKVLENLSKLNNWKFNKMKIYHQSKKFFQIVGIKVVSNFYKSNWDQPIIIQNEVGILGIIKNIKTKKLPFTVWA